MISLFKEYKDKGQIEEALLIGRNMISKEPSNYEYLSQFLDLLFNLAESLDLLEDKIAFVTQADIALTFFEENAELSIEIINNILAYRLKINNLKAVIAETEKMQNDAKAAAIEEENDKQILNLYNMNKRIKETDKEEEFERVLKEIRVIDSKIQHDQLTDKQTEHYDYLNRECTESISNKMREFEYQKNVVYNQKAVSAFETAYRKFKLDETFYKDQSQLFMLTSSTLFAFDAARLFNETLIYYNHVYSYIFNKLDEDGKFALTKFAVECEKKQG